jgi:hypothetical protein
MDWWSVFERIMPAAPATDDDIEFLQNGVLAPLTPEEVAAAVAVQHNPFPVSDPLRGSYKPFDPAAWILPRRRFPSAFAEFLQWSNGGCFSNDVRELDIFGTSSIRDYLLGYNLPQYMPGAVPFAFDGGGGLFLFDMRGDPQGDEFPIVFSHSGNLGWDEDEHIFVAATFIEAWLGTNHPRN